MNKKKHDPLFRWLFADARRTRRLLKLAAKHNEELQKFLESIDLKTLERIPDSYSEVADTGEADLAFRVNVVTGASVLVGILLEHKSYRKSDVLSQIYEYTFEVMVNKNATDFRWLQTKTIIIYNGQSDWDPLAEFREKHKEWGGGPDLPFECVLVNLADIPDKMCFAESNIEAAHRRLQEEMGFDTELEEIFEFKYLAEFNN